MTYFSFSLWFFAILGLSFTFASFYYFLTGKYKIVQNVDQEEV